MACLALAGVAAFYGASLLVQRNQRVAGALNRRLAESFGRAVEVGSFDVSLWGGPQLVARYVTVAEDPRFGHEYFLRAEQLTAGLRWTALFRGRLEFDSVALTRPSLNLVRTPEGQWNLENWLPWPGTAISPAEPGPPAPAEARRLDRVSIEGGRINFKRGVDKHPFAVTGVEGTVSQAGDGQWNIDVEGRPMRAGVVVQGPGTMHVRGTLGGTSARFRPANLAVAWEEVSLSDALRLLTGSDHGARGEVAIDGQVTAPPPESLSENPAAALWAFEGVLRVSGVHRWDLPPRDSDPAVNLGVAGKWWPSLARAHFERITLESSATQIRGSGFAQWGRAPAGYAGQEPSLTPRPDSNFRFVSSGISLNDLFRWYPAFRPGVAANLQVEGFAGIDAEVHGWPLRVERVVMASGGARLRGFTGGEATLDSLVLRYEQRRGRVELAPVNVHLGSPSGAPSTLRIEAAMDTAAWKIEAALAAQGVNVEMLMGAGAPLGIDPLRAWAHLGWQAAGAADVRVRWQGTLLPFAVEPLGSLRLRNVALRSPVLPEPIRIANAAVELASGEKRITLQSARAFGSVWGGTLRRRGNQPWEAVLGADALDAAAVHGALAPQLQPGGFLQRIAPGRTSVPNLFAALPGLRVRGRVSIGQLRFQSLLLEQFKGDLNLSLSAPWSLELLNASAAFFGGSISGEFHARAPEGRDAPIASYRAQLRWRGVNLAALTAGTPRLRGYFAGAADGELTLAATGANRQTLLDSLAGDGAMEIRNAQTTALDLNASLRSAKVTPGATALARAAGRFTLAERRLRFEELQLFARPARLSAPDWLVVGSADLSGSAIALDVNLLDPTDIGAQGEGSLPSGRTQSGTRRGYSLRGPLDALQLSSVVTASPRQ